MYSIMKEIKKELHHKYVFFMSVLKAPLCGAFILFNYKTNIYE